MIEEAIKSAVTEAIMSDEFAKLVAVAVAEQLTVQKEKTSTRELSDKEAADILRRSVSTIRKWKKEGRINSVQRGGIRVVRMCDVLGVKE